MRGTGGRCWIAWLAAAAVGLACGCAANRRAQNAPRGADETARIEPSPPPSGRDLIENLTRGVEVHRLLDRPFRQTLGPRLARYSAEPLGLSAEELEWWRSEGLRLVAVPLDDKALADLIRDLAHEPRIERIHMGVVPEWRPLATAARIEGSKFVRVDGEVAPFADGQFRLVMRAYPVLLGAEQRERLRVELIVQFHQPRRDPLRPDPPREERMGVFVPTTGLSIDLDGRWAIVITAERPEAHWKAAPPGAEAAETKPTRGARTRNAETTRAPGPESPPGEAAAPAPEVGAAQPPEAPPALGPEGPRVRSVGEETLISAEGDTRLVIILVPRME